MKQENLVKQLDFLAGANISSVELLILDEPKKDDDGNDVFTAYKGRMHKDMPGEIMGLFIPKIRKMLVSRDYELVPYEPALTPDRRVVWTYPTSNVPFFEAIASAFNSTKTEYYDDNNLPYSEIWAIWIKFKTRGKTFYIGKKITSSKVLTSGGTLAWVFRGETFNQVKDDVLAVDDHIDVFISVDDIYFEVKQNFEKAMLYTEVLQEAAVSTLDEIKKIDIVEDFDSLKLMLEDDQHSIRKLNKLKEKDYFRKKTFTDYHRIIKEYNVDIDVDVKAKKFTISGKAQAKRLIKVLNDDYLRSELTDIRYSANSKENI